MNDPVAQLESWLPVPGYEGLYEVSDAGRVRSLTRTVMRTGAKGGGRAQTRRGALLTPIRQNSNGHLQVRLSKDSVVKGLSIHCLVLEAFVGPRPTGYHALHANDVPNDNRLENLRWGTPAENAQDAIRNGRNANLRRERCRRDHEYTSRPDGSRICNTCINDRRRARRRNK